MLTKSKLGLTLLRLNWLGGGCGSDRNAIQEVGSFSCSIFFTTKLYTVA